MAGKTFSLTIALKALDKATAPVRKVTQRLERMAQPVASLNRKMLRFTNAAARGLRRVGAFIGKVAKGFLAAGAAIGLSVAAVKKWIDAGDTLAKTADRIGLTVDGLAQLRFAASQSGVDVADLDKGMEGFTRRIGEAKAGTGSLTTFLKKVSPTLLRNLKGTKSNEEALSLMAEAMAKLEDPSKRAALANAAFGRSGVRLINLLSQGKEGVEKLRGEYAELAGSQEASARASEKIKDALGRIDAVGMGLKASIITGLEPAFLKLSARAKDFFIANRGRVQEWVRDFGEKLPDRVDKLISGLRALGRVLGFIVDHVKELAVLFGTFKVAGLLGAFKSGAGGVQTFSSKLGSATAGLGLFAAGLMAAAAEIDRQQAAGIADKVKRGSARDVFLGKFSGGRSGFRSAQEMGLIGRTGRINRAAVEKSIMSDRHAMQKLAGTLSGSDRRSMQSETDTAIANIVAGQQQQRTRDLIGLLKAGVQQKAKVEVDIKAPPGTRATIDPRSNADLSVDLKSGPQVGTP